MQELPTAILDYIYFSFVAERWPAYILVSENGCLVDWGGHLERYGITRLQKGEPIGGQVDFLDGLLPLKHSPGFLTSIKTELGVVVDLHLFSSSEGDWALFLDATAEDIERRKTQQRLNELSLLLEKSQKS